METWLPGIRESADAKTRAEGLGQTGKQHLHLGDYDTALQYLKQSLVISQEIGNTAGLCATLSNVGHVHLQNEEIPQALEALEGLAGQLGLPGGLDAWQTLAQRMDRDGQ